MSTLQLLAADGNRLSAYIVKPEGTPRGAIVVVQEIFGVNSHIRRVAEQYAAAGYVAIAPALFDRLEKGVELGYDAAGLQAGLDFMARTTDEGVLADIRAAIDAKAVVIQGAVTGNVTAREKVEIQTTGSLSGDVSSPRLAIADGASIRGKVHVEQDRS